MMLSCVLAGGWIFLVWRLSGMPSPGFMGRIIPGAWVVAGVLSGVRKNEGWVIQALGLFTLAAWLWRLWEPGWIIAAALATGGVFLWSLRAPCKKPLQVITALVPVLMLILLSTEIVSDEVIFGEIAASITGNQSSVLFSERHMRAGDISHTVGHHTPLFPLVISPGLHAGDHGIRIVPVLLTILAVVLLSRLAGGRAALAAALLYPGFSILGLAMTGWLAAGALTFWMLQEPGKRSRWVSLFIVVFLSALKMRYAGLALGIVLAEYAEVARGRWKWRGPVLAVAACILLLVADLYLLKGGIFWTRYGNIEALKLIWINLFERTGHTMQNLLWSLVDTEGGLLPRAPWAAASFWGMAQLRKRDPVLFRRTALPALSYWLVLVVWTGTSWHGLPAPACRVFVPLVPMLALGLREVLDEPGTAVLILLSVVFPALVMADPPLRWNYADGTDSLLSAAFINPGFSSVRHGMAAAAVAAASFASLAALTGRKRLSRGFFVMVLLTLAVIAGRPSQLLETEDLPGGNAQGALLYPGNPDPVIRYFWFQSRERMLEMSSPEHVIFLETGLSSGTVVMEASSRGGYLTVNGDTIEVTGEKIELPGEYSMLRRDTYLPDRPENRLLQRYEVAFDELERPGGVEIRYLTGEPVYLDRAGVIR